MSCWPNGKAPDYGYFLPAGRGGLASQLVFVVLQLALLFWMSCAGCFRLYNKWNVPTLLYIREVNYSQKKEMYLLLHLNLQYNWAVV